MIVVITQMKEKKMSSDPREKEDEKADLKYELTLRKNELKYFGRHCIIHMKIRMIQQRKKNILSS